MRELIPASDDLLARRAGDYAREKLAFLEGFMAPALSIAGSMPDRTYLDLFAGPGLNRTERGQEFEGSPLIGLKARATAKHRRGFSRAVLVNFKHQVAAQLSARVARVQAAGESPVHPSAVSQLVGDTNVLLPDIMRGLPKRGYVLTFADITGIKHWPWSSVLELKAHGHSAVDLYMLFPIEMAINRFLAFDREKAEAYFPHLDAFFGTQAWRDAYERRATEALGADLRRELIELYLKQLRSQWKHVIVACAPGLSEARSYYRMFFATNHDAAHKAAAWAADRERDGELRLDL